MMDIDAEWLFGDRRWLAAGLPISEGNGCRSRGKTANKLPSADGFQIGVTYLPAGFHNVLPGPNAYRDEGATSLSEIEDVVRVSISGDARNPRNLDVPCDDVQLIGDHRTGEAVARYAHSRKTLSGPQRRSSPDGGQAGAAAEFGAGESEASRITHDNGVASGASVSAGLPFSVKSMVMTSSRTSCG